MLSNYDWYMYPTKKITEKKLVIDKMNPWGKEEDSVPPGGCCMIVTKLEDLSG